MAKSKSEPEESGMGFKDKQKALETLKVLDGRDISYQYHVITSFVSRAKRTLQITRDEEKLANLKEALKTFEDWLADYKENNRGKENLPYLPLETVKAFRGLARKYRVLDEEFYKAYRKEKGDYKCLRNARTPAGDTTWDIERNRRLKRIVERIKLEHVQWYETDVGEYRGLPTKEHARCILLGYSPDPTRLKKLIPEVLEKFGGEEEEEEGEEEGKAEEEDKEKKEEEDDDEMEVEEDKADNNGKGGKGVKRRHASSSSSESNEEEPERKLAKRSQGTEKDKKDKEKEKGKEDDKEEEREKEKEETGLGFKDKEKALRSIESLDGRDVSYQYHAIAGLVKRAERVISCTKDQEKIRNMRDAVRVFEDWITDYNANGRAKENFDYLSVEVVRAFKPLADRYNITDDAFLKAYEEVGGDYKKLRTVQVPGSDVTWDIERNRNLRVLVDRIKEKKVEWFETEEELRGLPTEEHTRCIMWAFSQDVPKLKKLLPSLAEKLKV